MASEELPPIIYSSEIRDEWIVFKQLMDHNYKACTLQSMASRLRESDVVKEQYPNILTLVTIALPVGSVDCERGFSKQTVLSA